MDDRRQPFPSDGLCFSLSVTNAASSSTSLPAVANDIRIVNEGPNHAYVHITTGSAVATVPGGTPTKTCCPILAGSDVGLSLPSSTALCKISAICAGSGTATLRISVGEGL